MTIGNIKIIDTVWYGTLGIIKGLDTITNETKFYVGNAEQELDEVWAIEKIVHWGTKYDTKSFARLVKWLTKEVGD